MNAFNVFGITFEWWEVILLLFALVIFLDCCWGFINSYRPTTLQKPKKRL